MSNLPSYVSQALAIVATNEGFGPGYSTEHSAGSKHGDGFASRMLAITLTDAHRQRTLSLICKLQFQPKDGDPEAFNSTPLFEREVNMYTNVLPMLAQLQRQHGLAERDGFFAYPKCYYAHYSPGDSESIIVLGNLRTEGYDMTDKTVPTTLEQMELFVRQLGRFNGLSFVLRDQQPDVFAPFYEFSDIELDVMTDKPTMMAFYRSSMEQSIEVVESPADKKMMRSVQADALALLRTRQSAERLRTFGVLNHGDCHINNMMFFKSEPNGPPTKIMILDWQVSSVQSPAIDLANFIFASTDKALRDQHLERLLRLYHEELTKIVTRCGSDASVFSFADLMAQLCEFSCDTLAHLQMVLPFLVTPPENMNNWSDLIDENGVKDANDVVTLSPLTDVTRLAYRKRLTDIIADFRRLGFV